MTTHGNSRKRRSRRRALRRRRALAFAAILLLVGLGVFLIFKLDQNAGSQKDDETSLVGSLDAAAMKLSLTAWCRDADLHMLPCPSKASDEVWAQILENAKTNEDIWWIAHNTEAYDTAAAYSRKKMFKFCAYEPEAVPFVRAYPEVYPAEQGEAYTDTVTKGEVPTLYQWDVRWGLTEFSSAAFGMTGCGPTVLSMVVMGLTGDNTYDPYTVGQMIDEYGYMSAENGTVSKAFPALAGKFGIWISSQTSLNAEEFTSYLQDGNLIICYMGEGHFAAAGHYLLACGVSDDGTIIIHDPNSAVNTAQTWDAQIFVDEAKGFFICRESR